MAVSGVVRVKLAIFGIICFVLWQALRTVPSASTSSDEGSGGSEAREEDAGAAPPLADPPGAQELQELQGVQDALSLQPVRVGVFYEALCPDSRSFVSKQLLPSFEKAPRLLVPDLVPYGKAQTLKLPDGTYRFTCQHGPLECQGNKVHACVIDKVKNIETQLKYIACMINDNMQPEVIGKNCAQTYGVPWEPIEQCSRGEEGDKLLKAFGDRTHDLSPKASFIPTILLNGKQDNQAAILKNLLREVCNLYPFPKPKECS